MYIDFHTHLHQYADAQACLDRMDSLDIMAVACSVDLSSYLSSLDLAERSPRVLPSFGIHPMHAAAYAERLDELEAYVEASPLIGEIGLDRLWWPDVPARLQERVFAWFLDQSVAADKYCVVHTKGAEKRVLEMLRYHRVEKAVIHWYHGPNRVYKKLLDHGYYQTFGCELRYSATVRRQLRQTPARLILAETDNPHSEAWLRSQRGWGSWAKKGRAYEARQAGPELILRVVEDIGRCRRIDTRLAGLLTSGNALRILGGEA